MSTKPTRRFVKLFQPQFAPLVKAGTKLQTIRPTPKRMPKAGDILDCREWTGKPYRSAQRRLVSGEITLVNGCTISESGVILGRLPGSALSSMAGVYEVMTQPSESREAFARADGFQSFDQMRDWFLREHGLPFHGVLIKWRVPQ